MVVTRLGNVVVGGALLSLVGACQAVGPTAIGLGRNQYSSILQSTSKQQTFANIIAVRHHEPTSFVDVAGVDAATTVTGTGGGTISGLGSKPGTFAELGSITGSATYTETPIVHYTPLLGAALVAQLVTPVGVDVLEDLANSDWKLAPLLDLSTSYITLDPIEFYPALNIMLALRGLEALQFAATKSDLTESASGASAGGKGGPARSSSQGNTGGTKASPNDSLTVYLNPFHPYTNPLPGLRTRELQLWIRLLWLYAGTQPKFPHPKFCDGVRLSASSAADLRYWDRYLMGRRLGTSRVNEILKCLPNSIELRNAPVKPAKAQSSGLISGAPLIETYSAIGILKNATELPDPKIGFVSPDRYRKIIGYDWNRNVDKLSFYTLLPETENKRANPAVNPGQMQINTEISDWLRKYPGRVDLYEPPTPNMDEFLNVNERLGSLRRYILIIESDVPPVSAYVSYFTRGQWYYIDGGDQISQKNFDLITLFLTMMAIPSAAPQVAPTISVGGG